MKVFKIEVRSDFDGWHRYNVFLAAVCTLPDGAIEYVAGAHTLTTPPCEGAEIYLYVVAREFPATTAVAAAPPFDVGLAVDGHTTIYKADQFGGLSAKLTVNS